MIKKIISLVLIIFVTLFCSAYLFLLVAGRNLIAAKLKGLTKRNVSIGYAGLTPPFKLVIKNLDIQGLMKADYISVSPSFLLLLSGRVGFNELKMTNPQIIYERFSAPAANAPVAIRPRVIFKRINISKGKLNILDHTVGKEAIQITVKDISFTLTNSYRFPHSVITNFELSGNVPWEAGKAEGKITAEGWLDLFKKDMKATLKVDGIDGVYLYPYYAQWVDLEKSRIESARLNFTSDINGLNNAVTADCHLELTDIMFKQRTPEEQQEKAEKIAYAVLDIFKALNKGKITLNFTIRTKMDNPKFGLADIKGALENKLADSRKNGRSLTEELAMLPGTFLGGTVRGATDLSKALIGGTFAVGSELKKSIETAFKKEKEE